MTLVLKIPRGAPKLSNFTAGKKKEANNQQFLCKVECLKGRRKSNVYDGFHQQNQARRMPCNSTRVEPAVFEGPLHVSSPDKSSHAATYTPL